MTDTIDLPRRPRSAAAIAFYTQVRHWHGYLSAFAFLALMFFSFTGIVLNHPDWLPQERDGVRVSATLPLGEVRSAQKSADPGAALGLLAAGRMDLNGAYSSADIDGGEAFLRFAGVKGSSDLTIDLATGAASGETRRPDTLTVLNDLHRGKNVGAAWRAVIDISGIVLLLLSLLGYILFFTLRFRLRVALVLTAVSLAAMAGIFIAFVP
jgi:uncharacterized protein